MEAKKPGESRLPTAEYIGGLTLDSLLTLKRPLDLDLSSDGQRCAFVVSPIAKERGRGLEARLWLGDVAGAARPVGEVGVTEAVPRFSPDGSELAFASDGGHRGRMTLRILGVGEFSAIPGSVEDIRWSPDGRRLLMLAADVGSDRAGIQSATRIREDGAPDDDPRVSRPAQYWRRLVLVDRDSGKTTEVTPAGVNVFEFDWVGGKVAAVCTYDPSESGWYGAWIGLIEVESRVVEHVYAAQWQLQCPRISREGSIAWIEGLASDRGLVTGTAHVLGVGPLSPDLDVTWLAFSDEKTLWYAGRRRSGSMFGKLLLDGSSVELFGGDLLIGERTHPRVTPCADGVRVAAVVETVDDPPEVLVLENGSKRAITSLNAELRPLLSVAEWRRYVWKSLDSLEIEGMLALPRTRKDKPLPLVVCVHGGPTSTWSWMVHTHRIYPLALVQEGYAVFLPNPRGSVGRGQEFARANLGDMGGADLQDLLTGVDALVADGIADDARVAITGGSYGGFISGWAVTQTDRFAAAVPCALVSDWLSFHLTTNIGQFDSLFMAADPFGPDGNYLTRSPVCHAHKCTTPTLLLHGEADLCAPVSQAIEFYNALVEAGCETELVVYPREGHVWLEREHQIDAWYRMRDWLARHLSR